MRYLAVQPLPLVVSSFSFTAKLHTFRIGLPNFCDAISRYAAHLVAFGSGLSRLEYFTNVGDHFADKYRAQPDVNFVLLPPSSGGGQLFH